MFQWVESLDATHSIVPSMPITGLNVYGLRKETWLKNIGTGPLPSHLDWLGMLGGYMH